jgi:glycosyltransferase involved in cell wall biosynthesis
MYLTIAAANVDSPEWVELLVKSVRKFTAPGTYEIIIVDNGSLERNLEWLKRQPDIRLIENKGNLGHGRAMDQAVEVAIGQYICVLDIDAHIQRTGWENDLVALYYADPLTRLIGCVGPAHKPLHPPLFFFERDFIRNYGLRFMFHPDGDPRSTDTAQLVYWQILDLGHKVLRLEKGTKIYPDCIGDEIWIGDKATLYHHWYGTRFRENTDKPQLNLDGYTLRKHLENKARVFAQPLVREILGNDGTNART